MECQNRPVRAAKYEWAAEPILKISITRLPRILGSIFQNKILELLPQRNLLDLARAGVW